MAFRQGFLGELFQSISSAVQRIKQVTQYEAQSEYRALGIYENQWQRPISEFGEEDPQWTVKIKSSDYVGEIDFGRKEWARSREAVDAVLELLLQELRKEAATYEGLKIDSYIRQGSSRDGLKVVAADEFDTMLEFHIEGLENCIKQTAIDKNVRFVPGFCFMVVENMSLDRLESRFPKLCRANVFVASGGRIHLSSRNLHQRVFESMFDRACNKIIEEIKAYNNSGQKANFSISRRMNPPAINITIHLDDGAHQLFMKQGQPKNTANLVKEIDVDIVPAILLRYDNSTRYEGVPLNCPIHAVCKWAEEERARALEFVDSSLVWDVKTTGYEKHLLDRARQQRRNLYILTALRIIKTYFIRTKRIAQDAGHGPPQIVTVLKSYHLKQIAIYLIFYMCHKHPNFKLYGAKRATLYFIDMLSVALENQHLPHFFYSNNNIDAMLPGFPQGPPGRWMRYDLFRGISKEALSQAKQSLDNHLTPNLGFGIGGEFDSERDVVLGEFRGVVSRSDYF